MNQNSKPPTRPPARNQVSVFGTPWPLETELLRTRLRYISARFLQVPEPRISLRNTEEMLRWAQQLQDDGMPRSATELTRLAIEEDPTQRPLWQFLLARTFEDEDGVEFAELAQAFTRQFPSDEAMAEIEAMRQALTNRDGTHVVMNHSPVPTNWRVSAALGRDDGGQRALHQSLLQVMK